jgi:coiled-coil and C2 domain-containing protein 2A
MSQIRAEMPKLEPASRVILRLCRATGVPKRCTAGIPRDPLLFARMTLGAVTKESRRVPGNCAVWNEEFDFGLGEPPASLRVDLFDQVDFLSDQGRQIRHHRLDDRHLGVLVVALSSIWATGRLDGDYRVDSPVYELGYNDAEEPLRLSLYATLDPLFAAEEELESDPQVRKWQKRVKSMNLSRRRIQPIVTVNGKSFLACQAVKPQPPPSDFTEPLQILRFVSVTSAGHDERAIMLCNLLKHRGLEVYVALGYDLLNGATAFVVSKGGAQETLYDPSTGCHWSARDRFCSFYNVGIVFESQNIWVNIQPECAPWRIDWNFHDSRKWLPLFTGTAPLESPPSDVPQYEPPDDLRARQLQRQLEYEIRGNVERWRDHLRTPWNPDFGDHLLRSLETCERACRANRLARCEPAAKEIRNRFPNYRMNGAPFCLRFVTMESIMKEVEVRGTWKTEAQDVNFALAVHVAPYPNGVLVAWVVLAALEYIPETRRPI